jgi:GNAT superfamily N-acetyltransferase
VLNLREAQISDIRQIQLVRNSVKENTLSDPALVTDKNVEEYLTIRGKGWICEIDKNIVGFSIADLKEHSVWALFVKPEHEGKGVGKKLHDTMLDWYFSQTKEKISLGTSSDTRAEKFYKLSGWTETGRKKNKASPASSLPWTEIKFEMTYADWMKSNSQQQASPL